MKPLGISTQKQMPRIESVAHAFHGAFGFNMPNRNIHGKREKRGDENLAKKHNKPTTTATPTQIPYCLRPPTPKPTKPVRFALNGKTHYYKTLPVLSVNSVDPCFTMGQVLSASAIKKGVTFKGLEKKIPGIADVSEEKNET
jgi:hypothetical protein